MFLLIAFLCCQSKVTSHYLSIRCWNKVWCEWLCWGPCWRKCHHSMQSAPSRTVQVDQGKGKQKKTLNPTICAISVNFTSFTEHQNDLITSYIRTYDTKTSCQFERCSYALILFCPRTWSWCQRMNLWSSRGWLLLRQGFTHWLSTQETKVCAKSLSSQC